MEQFTIALRICAIILIVITAFPLIRHDFWTFRIFEFARAQKLILNLFFLSLYSCFFSFFKLMDTIVWSILILNLLYLIYQVFPYLPIAKKQIKSADKSETPSIKLLVGNVYQYNREFKKLNDQILAENPDLVLLVETDKWWKDQCISSFGKNFPEQILQEKENTYGMLLFSKLTLSDTQVRYLIDEEIPSITTNVTLKNGELIKLFALHPVPPVPTQNLYSTDRDAEILLIGKEAKKEKLPVIVAGDLNDVAWSYTTNLFQKISGLLDPRRGRGFYSTFHAQKPLFRWPLDHIFCSTQFRLQSMKRLKNIGSDHFPILVQLHLAPTEDNTDQLNATEEEKRDASEKIENGKNNH